MKNMCNSLQLYNCHFFLSLCTYFLTLEFLHFFSLDLLYLSNYIIFPSLSIHFWVWYIYTFCSISVYFDETHLSNVFLPVLVFFNLNAFLESRFNVYTVYLLLKTWFLLWCIVYSSNYLHRLPLYWKFLVYLSYIIF